MMLDWSVSGPWTDTEAGGAPRILTDPLGVILAGRWPIGARTRATRRVLGSLRKPLLYPLSYEGGRQAS